MCRASLVLILLLSIVVVALCDEPQSQPISVSASTLIQEGTALFDKGLYDDSIKKYKDAIALEPGNDQAIYELAYAYATKGDLELATSTAERGIALKGEHQWLLLMLAGTMWDQRGQPAKAVEIYKAGLQLKPDSYLLHFNLGVTYATQSKLAEARRELESSLEYAPNHPGTLYSLGQVYLQDGYRIPALLVLSRFLTLDTPQERKQNVRTQLDRLFRAGYQVDAKTGGTTVTVDPDSKKDEGDFSAGELGLLLAQGGTDLELKENKLSAALLPVVRLSTAIAILAEAPHDEKEEGFAAKFLVPFFVEMHKQKLVEAFAHVAYDDQHECAEWIEKHRDELSALDRFTRSYTWKKASGAK